MRLRLALILMLSAATAQVSTVAQGTMPEHADADRRWLADKTASAHDANSLRLWQATYTTAKTSPGEGFPAKSLAGWRRRCRYAEWPCKPQGPVAVTGADVRNTDRRRPRGPGPCPGSRASRPLALALGGTIACGGGADAARVTGCDAPDRTARLRPQEPCRGSDPAFRENPSSSASPDRGRPAARDPWS